MSNPGKEKLVKLYYQDNKTLQEIASQYVVSRERVRQWMERHNLPRHIKKIGRNIQAESLGEYFEAIKNGKRENITLLLKFIFPLKKQCAECPSTKNLHIHHLKYPALSLKDIQILCCSCHIAKHHKGNGHKVQLEICNKYIKGKDGVELAREYNCVPTLIYQILRRWNIDRRNGGRTYSEALKPRDREIRRRYIQGESGLELAKRYKTTYANIYRILQNGNVKRRSQVLAQKLRHDNKGDLTS